MTLLKHSRRVAIHLTLGHFLIFAYGIIIVVFGLDGFSAGGDRSDMAQILLMCAPLAMVSLAAFRRVSEGVTDADTPGPDNPPVAAEIATLQMRVIWGFLLMLFALYSLTLFSGVASDPSTIKLVIGTLETALGGYLMVIRETLFPDRPRPSVPVDPFEESSK